MTRKRFIKLYMSLGLSRNDVQNVCDAEARWYAEHPKWGNFCYADFWDQIMDFYEVKFHLPLCGV